MAKQQPKQPTSVSLSVDQLKALDDARERLARGDEKPSRNAIMREAIAKGLPLVVGEPASRKAG